MVHFISIYSSYSFVLFINFFIFARILGRMTKPFSECINTIENFQKEISLPWWTMFNHGSIIQTFGEQRPFFCLAMMTFTPSCNFSTCIQCLDLGKLRICKWDATWVRNICVLRGNLLNVNLNIFFFVISTNEGPDRLELPKVYSNIAVL